MAHNFNVSSLVSKQLVQSLHAKGQLINTVNKAYSKDFTQKNYVPGQTVTIDIEPQYTITSGRVAAPQNLVHKNTTVTLGQYNGAFELTSIQKGFDIDGWRKYADGIAGRLIREMEVTGFQTARDRIPQYVGTPGTEPGSLRLWSEGRAKLTNALGPMRDYHAAASPMAMVALTDALKGAVNPGEEISNQFLKGRMRKAAGLNFYESPSIARHTAGTMTNATPLTNGAVSSGAATIAIDGLNAATATITKGTRFTIADVYAVDPETKQQLPYLREFVVTEDKTGSGSAIAALPIFPTIYGPGDSRQNVSALPANDKAITLSVTAAQVSSCNLIYDPDALTLVSVPLPASMTEGIHKFSNYEGIQLRVGIYPPDGINDTEILRIDAVWAWGVLREDHACIVYGA